jgi:4-amino-4-deoxy-L-arabinose transferase-like glycosyltransferase
MDSVSPEARAESPKAGVLSPNARAGTAAGACLMIALAAALAVDSRLDRHWILRGITLVVALACAAVLAADQGRKARPIIGLVGVVMFGVIFPVSSTTWSKPPEIKFALSVADDAKAAAQKQSASTVTVADVKAAAEARGGAVGTLKSDRSPTVRGADAYPLIIRAKQDQGRPWSCLTFEHGLTAKIRAC